MGVMVIFFGITYFTLMLPNHLKSHIYQGKTTKIHMKINIT